jgi:hypothetical protein
MATITRDSEVAARPPGILNCRVFERYPSDLPTQCQPLAARGDEELFWQASVHDISASGVGLLVHRRFEPKTGLAVELPDGDDSVYTVFVRVVHALGQPRGLWLLGCSFVTPLSEERLNALLLASSKPARPKAPPQAETTKLPEVAPKRNRSVIEGVRFRASLPDGTILSRWVTRLHMTGNWPMAQGRIVSVWLGKGKKDRTAVELRVDRCHEHEGQWVVECSFVNTPSAELVKSLKRKRPSE